MSSTVFPTLNLDHLRRLTGPYGIFEHALFDQARTEHGYTTDDNARVVVVLARMSSLDVEFDLQPYLDFVVGGATANGWHNRMSAVGEWLDRRGPDDTHGRAIWALGEAIATGVRDVEVVDAFQAAIHSFDSTHPRSLAYAVFGVVAARESVSDPMLDEWMAGASLHLPQLHPGLWRWPSERLTYDNARLPESLIRAGRALDDPDLTQRGLDLLEWLVDLELTGKIFSFTPVGGRGQRDVGPSFDQQPIEAWAMADACFAALGVNDDDRWRNGVIAAANWFLGENDAGLALYDPDTGAGFDGLEPGSVNQNRGAESTLSALGALIRRAQLDHEDY